MSDKGRWDFTPAEPERSRLRQIFDGDAELYDRARPGYPGPVFDRLAAVVPAPAHVLEIGCGTGQATRDLAERGYRVTAVELGASMAATARRNLRGHDAVTVVSGAFEEWSLPDEPFDVVLAATAFHWLDPAVRVVKSADALRPGGVLATIATQHIAGGTAEFFVAAQRCYERFDPDTPPGLRLEPAGNFPFDDADVRREARFGPATFFRYEWEHEYRTAEYLDLLMTYSGHRALADDRRAGLLACLAALIDGEHGGRIVKRYLTELRLAQRVG
ncbi:MULTISPECIES: class I SAM-dependent methyltransferase [Actinoplanes]|uniref:class I SAM-dependent methyltransferase n=1 Tax=Actinoplanes TaxID=1865 RepID=UPI0005F2ED68|nr:MULTISPECIES: class I SAM-dependent methyltransferase [Actinoplanes]GLY06828.1 methyltransferase type 11 [Actinoplanes sp. NBRC 101535]